MQKNAIPLSPTSTGVPWNKGKLIGAAPPATTTTTKSKWYPDHAVLSGATKESLKNMAEFKYD